MALALVEQGNDLLYRYIPRDRFQKRFGHYHPDPLIEEFTYGEGGGFSAFIWNNVNVGSRIFFHAFIGGMRYLTSMYYISDFFPAAVGRQSNEIKNRYKNPHLHPESFPDWWGGDYDFQDNLELEIKKAYESGLIYNNVDVILVGDPKRSYDIRKSPIILDKEVLSRLDFQGKPIKWDIVDKNGRHFDENGCINSCLRPPRVLSRSDGDLLENIIRQRVSGINLDNTFNTFKPIDSINASIIQLNCSNEIEIEKYIVDRLNILDINLKYLDEQVRLNDGSIIDILAEYNDKTPVIIEIKKGSADDSTLAQVFSYIYQYKKQHPNKQPIGKIVCSDASYRLKNACEHLGIEIHFYGDILFKN
jgi:hypothetical protein